MFSSASFGKIKNLPKQALFINQKLLDHGTDAQLPSVRFPAPSFALLYDNHPYKTPQLSIYRLFSNRFIPKRVNFPFYTRLVGMYFHSIRLSVGDPLR
jgi:hypothetical protein